jgi:SRSO17 transposase
VTRWRIEEDHQLAKQSTGLDAGQVIRWKSWHRWTAICLLACIYLAVAIQRQQGVVRPDRTRQSDVP